MKPESENLNDDHLEYLDRQSDAKHGLPGIDPEINRDLNSPPEHLVIYGVRTP